MRYALGSSRLRISVRGSAPKPPSVRNRQTAVAISKPLSFKEMTPKSPPRHGNQQGSVSAKASHLLGLFRQDLVTRYGERTVPDYLVHARELVRWLEERGIELGQARTEDLLAYQSELLALRKRDGKPYSVGFQINRLSAMKALFRFLYRRSFVLQDVAASLEFPRGEQKLPRAILTKEEARRLIEAAREKTARGLRDRAILETLYATGLRVSELSALTPYDVDTTERTLRVLLGKGRKGRTVPLTAAAAEAIEDYLLRARPELAVRSRTPQLFIADRGGKIHRAVFARIVRRYVRKTGLKKRVTCHTFRHSVATHLLQGGADIRQIQALLGHSQLSTTERYTRVEISDLRDVIDRAHPRAL
jgi:integrase/recombinase XerD